MVHCFIMFTFSIHLVCTSIFYMVTSSTRPRECPSSSEGTMGNIGKMYHCLTLTSHNWAENAYNSCDDAPYSWPASFGEASVQLFQLQRWFRQLYMRYKNTLKNFDGIGLKHISHNIGITPLTFQSLVIYYFMFWFWLTFVLEYYYCYKMLSFGAPWSLSLKNQSYTTINSITW